MFDIPILFLTFNRLETAKKVFAQIKKQQPKYLFLASDGPRTTVPDEKETVNEVRNYLLSEIDWNCELKTLFRDENLGCGKAVSSAITWFFENVDMGIILEDDCLPSDSFFMYCKELLLKYKSNGRVMHIAGNNPLGISSSFNDKDSYYFSKIQQCWGWATWKRAWQNYSFKINNSELQAFLASKEYHSIFKHIEEIRYWKRVLNQMTGLEIDTWDYQWVYSILKNKGLVATPCKNMISNIGFDPNALHTADITARQNNQERYEINNIFHPEIIDYNEKLCDEISETHFCIPVHNLIGYYTKHFFKDILFWNVKQTIKKTRIYVFWKDKI